MPGPDNCQLHAREVLRKHLAVVAEHGNAEHGLDDCRGDFQLETDEGLVVVQAKRMDSTRLKELAGGLAVGILELMQVVRMNAQPIVMLELPKVGPKAILFAGQFMNRHAPDLGWCLFDPHGNYALEIPAFNVSERRSSRPERGQRMVPAREALFSDLNRLMLKILLLRDAPRRNSRAVHDRLFRQPNS